MSLSVSAVLGDIVSSVMFYPDFSSFLSAIVFRNQTFCFSAIIVHVDAVEHFPFGQIVNLFPRAFWVFFKMAVALQKKLGENWPLFISLFSKVQTRM